ncbi:hypothetical protein P4S72_16635 [Vibrio sp. PP-XX7]
MNELNPLSQYDALFIRETTAIDHHTYRLAIEAENLGLVVMDDPSSICVAVIKFICMHAFSYKKFLGFIRRCLLIPATPHAIIWNNVLSTPLVLKMPEGFFFERRI